MAEDMNIEENASVTEGTVDSVQSANMIVEEEEEPETELDNLWKAVNNDPRDFTSWTYLLDFVEKGDDIENARKAFDQFLSRYPFCYGYWKKYAELEKRHHDLERCIEVYERGVKAIPMSVDLWTAYLDTALDIYQTSEDFEWTIKSIYERSIEAAGLEFRSDKLWEHYISWTSNNGRLSDATKIYDQLLRTATQMYYQNWENFKKHVEDNETQSIIPPEELELWKKQVLSGKKGAKKDSLVDESSVTPTKEKEGTADGEESLKTNEADTKESETKEKEKEEKTSVADERSEVKEETENGQGESNTGEGSVQDVTEETKPTPKPEESGEEAMKTENGEVSTSEKKDNGTENSAPAEEISASDWKTIKTKFIEDREAVYQKTYDQITKRWYFEEKIRRPYFHVKPLEKSQLANWREYLDMEMAEGDFKRVCSLFERCLIACALYDEFWVRYAMYLESHNRIEDARHVWENACTVHLPHRAHLHWRWALFEERQNNSKAAVEVITRGQRESIGDVKIAVRRLSLLRRSGTISNETLCAEYESTIERFASENIACASVLSLKYARFLDRERGDREQAERVLREAIARDETNERLYMQLVDLNYRQPSFDWRACDRVLAWIVGLTSLPRRLRLRFCQRRYEMLEEASDDVIGISSALRDYEELQEEVDASERDAATDAANAQADPATQGAAHAADTGADEPPSKRARSSTSASGGGGGGDTSGYSSSAYDASYHHHYASGPGGDAAAMGGDVAHMDNSGYGGAQGSNPQAYAAAAAAAAANAAYPGYSGAGNAAWDSYYNSYYGYYAGYYGAGGEHGEWQSQGAS